MRTIVRMPNLGAEASTGRIVAWIRGVGDRVAAGDPIAEIETDKATVELEATVSGMIIEVSQPEGAEVGVGGTLAVIEHD